MATRPMRGLDAVQFEASQMPNMMNQTPGKVVFGEEALAAYERALIRHIINQQQGRTSDHIKRVALSMPRRG